MASLPPPPPPALGPMVQKVNRQQLSSSSSSSSSNKHNHYICFTALSPTEDGNVTRPVAESADIPPSSLRVTTFDITWESKIVRKIFRRAGFEVVRTFLHDNPITVQGEAETDTTLVSPLMGMVWSRRVPELVFSQVRRIQGSASFVMLRIIMMMMMMSLSSSLLFIFSLRTAALQRVCLLFIDRFDHGKLSIIFPDAIKSDTKTLLPY